MSHCDAHQEKPSHQYGLCSDQYCSVVSYVIFNIIVYSQFDDFLYLVFILMQNVDRILLIELD